LQLMAACTPSAAATSACCAAIWHPSSGIKSVGLGYEWQTVRLLVTWIQEKERYLSN
jgi:hypothetical protein